MNDSFTLIPELEKLLPLDEKGVRIIQTPLYAPTSKREFCARGGARPVPSSNRKNFLASPFVVYPPRAWGQHSTGGLY